MGQEAYDMQENKLWNDLKNMFQDSKKDIRIYEGNYTIGNIETEKNGINSNSVLGVIISFTSGICIDNWIRIVGQQCDNRNGISYYNSIEMNQMHLELSDMLLVAYDVIGGVFAINRGKFAEGAKKVWYFAPDTLEWECLEMSYSEFIAWVAQGDTDEFYNSMRWNQWQEDCKNIDFDKSFLIYPFLWSRECEINHATKKVVPFSELMSINFEYVKTING